MMNFSHYRVAQRVMLEMNPKLKANKSDEKPLMMNTQFTWRAINDKDDRSDRLLNKDRNQAVLRIHTLCVSRCRCQSCGLQSFSPDSSCCETPPAMPVALP
ncbi:hypothetical protein AVEN_131359-1 [Araneus ventricosus]|uniref:Uncharacterized protein n=1 Tax=Araneus ventricosus TaxID=182803 RepID=A0A4Y2R324_ARAVE|nr:hypothetical protein AVEN_131359-1 [Araneus ventricosus]